jgi:hypothetical protein
MKRLLVALLVAGCSSTVVLDRELPKLVGQPVDVAVQKLGMPTSEQTIMGRKVYVWSNTEQDVSLAPAFGMTTMGGPRTAQTTALVPVATSGTCIVRLAVDDRGIIRSAEHQGDSDACYRWSNRLKR